MNHAEELIKRLNETVAVWFQPNTSADGTPSALSAQLILSANKTYEVIRQYFKEQSDKSTKLVSAWANVMGDFNIKAVDGKIDLDDARKIISTYIGDVLDEINGEKEQA